MADYEDLLAAEKAKKEQVRSDRKKDESAEPSVSRSPVAEKPSEKEGLHKPKTTDSHQLVNQPINQSINQLTKHLDVRIMNKPKGFYISEKLDKRFDKAVSYFEEKHQLKIDRSILLNTLLEDDSVWDEQSLDKLIDRLINQLTRKLTNR